MTVDESVDLKKEGEEDDNGTSVVIVGDDNDGEID